MVEVLTSVRGPGSIPGCREPSCGAVPDTAFGDKDAIYAQAAAQFITMIDARLAKRPERRLGEAIDAAFDVAIEVYTTDGLGGCFVICTAEALTTRSGDPFSTDR